MGLCLKFVKSNFPLLYLMIYQAYIIPHLDYSSVFYVAKFI